MRGLRSCPSVHGRPRPPTNIAVRSGRSTPPTRMRSCRTPGDRVLSASRSLRVALSRPTITWRRMGTLAGPSVPARTTTPDARTALHPDQRASPAGSAVEMRRHIQHARRRDELVPHPSQGRVACSVSVRAQLRQEADRSSARRHGAPACIVWPGSVSPSPDVSVGTNPETRRHESHVSRETSAHSRTAAFRVSYLPDLVVSLTTAPDREALERTSSVFAA